MYCKSPETRDALRHGIEPRTAYEEICKTLLLTLSEALRRGDKRSSEAAYLLVGVGMRDAGGRGIEPL